MATLPKIENIMEKNNFVNMSVSYVFFFLCMFTILTIATSHFLSIFEQLFILLTRDGRVYDILTYFFILLGFFLSIGSLIVGSWNQNEDFIQKILILSLGMFFIFVFVFLLSFSQDSVSITGYVLKSTQSVKSIQIGVLEHIWYVFMTGFFYIFFILLPLFCKIMEYVPNPKNKIGNLLKVLYPSLNVIIIFVFASSIQPFFSKPNLYSYIDLLLFVLSLAFLVRVVVSDRKSFGFYECVNLALLVFGIVFFIISTDTLVACENYFVARESFYAFGFLAWCFEWMYKYATRTYLAF